MNIKAFQENWNALGRADPMWAVLTDPTKKNNRWDRNEFFANGVAEIEWMWQGLQKLNIEIRPGTAIDFGCGLGRLTQALCQRFEKYIGIDISDTMIDTAREYNQFPDKCSYLVNAAADLGQLSDASADFILSRIALEHTATAFQKQYISDFLRILKPGGVACFQVVQPSFVRSLLPDFIIEHYRRWKHGVAPFIGMYGLQESEVRKIVAAHGAKVIDCNFDRYTGNENRWVNYNWCVQK